MKTSCQADALRVTSVCCLENKSDDILGESDSHRSRVLWQARHLLNTFVLPVTVAHGRSGMNQWFPSHNRTNYVLAQRFIRVPLRRKKKKMHGRFYESKQTLFAVFCKDRFRNAARNLFGMRFLISLTCFVNTRLVKLYPSAKPIPTMRLRASHAREECRWNRKWGEKKEAACQNTWLNFQSKKYAGFLRTLIFFFVTESNTNRTVPEANRIMNTAWNRCPLLNSHFFAVVRKTHKHGSIHGRW